MKYIVHQEIENLELIAETKEDRELLTRMNRDICDAIHSHDGPYTLTLLSSGGYSGGINHLSFEISRPPWKE